MKTTAALTVLCFFLILFASAQRGKTKYQEEVFTGFLSSSYTSAAAISTVALENKTDHEGRTTDILLNLTSATTFHPISLPQSMIEDPYVSEHYLKREIIPANERAYMGFALGDINGDAMADIAIQEGGPGGPLVWFAHTKDALWEKHIIAAENPSGIHFASGDTDMEDIDGDGDMDVLGFEHIGEFQHNYTGDTLSSVLHWFENMDKGKRWKEHTIGTFPDYVKDVEIRDFNRDGKQDIVAISFRNDQRITVFRQNSASDWTRVFDRSIEGLHEGMDCGDIDGDGDIDIATNGYWIENPGGDLTGSWTLHVFDPLWFSQQEAHWRRNATKVVCVDINKDGKAEIFVSHSEKDGYPVCWYEAQYPRNGHWQKHVIAEGLTAVHTLQVADVNLDGKLDVLAGENGGHFVETDDTQREVRLFLNTGDNLQWEVINLKNDGLYNGLLYDINGDGKLDICGPAGHEKDAYYIWLHK
ncbi:MAG: VCBS repeat-containing protein [Bacteroidota bacterium]